jgi:basic amino acid/polyamine antiporter, APA family
VVTVTVAAGLVTTGDLAGLADTAVLLLLLVFAVVNVAVLVLRGDPVGHGHFRAPTWAPALGAVACLVLASPLTGRDLTTYVRAGLLLGIGVLLWGVNRLAIRRWSSVPPA